MLDSWASDSVICIFSQSKKIGKAYFSNLLSSLFLFTKSILSFELLCEKFFTLWFSYSFYKLSMQIVTTKFFIVDIWGFLIVFPSYFISPDKCVDDRMTVFQLGKIIFKSRMRFPSVIVTRELRYVKVLCRIFLETLTLFMLVNFNCFMRTGYKLLHLPDFFFKWSIQMYSHFYGNLFSQQCIMTRNYLFRERQSVCFWKTRLLFT